jgi:hypothetical protein
MKILVFFLFAGLAIIFAIEKTASEGTANLRSLKNERQKGYHEYSKREKMRLWSKADLNIADEEKVRHSKFDLFTEY